MGVMTSIAIAGIGMQVYGMIKGGQAAKNAGEKQQEAANSQADLSDVNAANAELQATDAIQRGQIDEAKYRSLVQGVVGTQRAGYAAMGVDVNYGSPVDVQADTVMTGELDAMTIRQNARREAWGYKTEAYDLKTRASIQRKEGVSYAAAGRAQRSAALISGVGSAATSTASLLEAKYGFGKKK